MKYLVWMDAGMSVAVVEVAAATIASSLDGSHRSPTLLPPTPAYPSMSVCQRICGMQAAAETATEHVRFQLRSASCMGRFTFHSYRFMHCSAPNIFLYSRGLADVRTGMGRSGFIYFVARYSL
ncbi:uncharacterized protein [Oryza sativa Japonica Group]|uniref:uncharacterized protein isoform X1 n=2 Tax=Oryza sativa subsp. japonica TaxID=39947 RepID=UPI00339CA8D2